MNKLLRLLHTVKYLRLRQIAWRIYYILKNKLGIVTKVQSEAVFLGEFNRLNGTEFLPSSVSFISSDEFIFLNQRHKVRDWNEEGIDKLWLYNLHYFDYLFQENIPSDEIIYDWIQKNPVGVGNGWEPYSISLRGLNWIKYHIHIKPLNSSQIDSLQKQVDYLEKNLEYHILGNHLFENAKLLYSSGLFFNNKQLLQKGLGLLNSEINEQILDDGAHFELSPMYHSIILVGMLDIVNLSRMYSYDYPQAWNEKINTMISFLTRTLHKDGEISYFNDSVLGIAHSAGSISAYATRLGFNRSSKENNAEVTPSGLIRFENSERVMLIDGGRVGPDYIPGHAHADNLSFELSTRDTRVFVNSGISTYERCTRRTKERSTRAHNTVVIDGKNQSDVWSSFRVGKRVVPKNLRVRDTVSCKVFEGSYSGELHKRIVNFYSDDIEVNDIIAKVVKSSEAFYHLYPGISITVDENKSSLRLVRNDQVICKLELGDFEFFIEKYEWAEGFNKLKDSLLIKVILRPGQENKIKISF